MLGLVGLQAPRNWTLCRDKFLQSLDNRKGWSVKNMIYEATMWKIVHNLPVALRAAAVEAEKAWKSESNAYQTFWVYEGMR